MVGLGETHEEMVETFAALREHGVQVLTVGQYLRPSERHLPVVRYWHPDEFAALETAAYELGFDHVAAGPARALLLPRRPARRVGGETVPPAPGRSPRSERELSNAYAWPMSSSFARTRTPALAASVAALAAALAGCGSSAPVLQTAATERAIAQSILTERHIQTKVRCPAHVERRAGVAFTCAARLGVGAYPVHVVETNSAGHVRYASQAPLVVLDTAKVKHAIAASILAQRKLRASVRCPTQVLQQAGIQFACTATIAGRDYPFEVTEIDAAGHVEYVGR